MVTDLKTTTKSCRLLYYGPTEAGKRANLRLIHQSIAPEHRLSIATDDPERHIAFTVRHGDGSDWQVLIQAVDAGRERPRIAGMSPRPPFDGIVFVVDSGASMLDQSLASLESLKHYLDSWDLDLMGVPLVIQYNRRDRMDTLAIDRLESLLNPWGLLSFPANAAEGEGIRETLKAVLGLTVNHLQIQPEAAMPATSAPNAVPSAAPVDDGLGIDYGPPVPGNEIGESTKALGNAIFEGLRPPVVIPVRIPRRLVQGDGPLRILVEVEIDDDE